MKPCVYVDFTVLSSGNGASLPTPVIAGGALKCLHGAFMEDVGQYAVALPQYQSALFSKLRVFTEDRSYLDKLVGSVEKHPIIRDYTQIGYPRQVPDDFVGTWTEYRRYRIPTRKAGRKPNDTLRERRIQHADDQRLPFFIMQSRSTGQQFGLYVDIQTKSSASEECLPDSYGLSVTSRSFALPDIP